VLLERERELSEIDRLIGTSLAGEGRLLVVEGRAGLGKTALMAEVRSRAARRGMSVCVGRGAELEGGFAFGLVRQLFEPVVRRSGAGLFEGAAGLAAPVFGMSDGAAGEAQLSAFHGLYWLAADLSENAPVLLAVDDAHWTDGPSLRWLAYLLNRLEGLAMLVVLATRPIESGTPAEALAGIVADPDVHHLRLEALGEESVAALIALELGVEPDPEFTTACHRATAGNPLALRGLLRDLAARKIQPAAAAAAALEQTAPTEIGHRALAMLAPLGEPANRLARALSVVGDGLDLRLLSALSGLDPGQASEIAHGLVNVDLIAPERPLRFAHPLLRTAVYDAIPAGVRSGLHLRAADLLAAEGMDGEAVAAHLLRSEPASSEETVGRLMVAAPLAMRRGAPDAAIAYLRRALAEVPGGEQQTALLFELGRAELLTRNPAAGGHLRQALACCQDPVARAAIQFNLATAAQRDGDSLQAVDLLNAALEELGDREPEMSGRIEAFTAGYVAIGPAAMARVRDPVARLRQVAEGHGHAARTALLVLAYLLAARGQVQEAVACVQQGLDGGRYFAEGDYAYGPAASAASALTLADELDRARSLANSMLADASSRGDVSAYVAGSFQRASAELQAGRLAEAEADARAALDLGRQLDHEFVPYAAEYLSLILLERGQLGAAEAVVESVHLKAGLAGSLNDGVLRLIRGMVRCAGSQTAEGIADLRAAGQVFEALRMPSIAWRPPLALALPRSSMSEARQLAETELGLARAMGVRGRIGMALRTMAALSPDPAAVDLLRQAITTLQDTPAVLELARAQLDLGAALRRLGHPLAARDPLRQALEIASRCGAVRIAERARSEALLAGARPRRSRLSGIHALTPGELRVARLAAEGRTNREVAQALFITTKTVKDHLSNAYGKLQVTSRAELAGALGASD
jgi:DNA-binding CsgD family transcriptional regulator